MSEQDGGEGDPMEDGENGVGGILCALPAFYLLLPYELSTQTMCGDSDIVTTIKTGLGEKLTVFCA